MCGNFHGVDDNINARRPKTGPVLSANHRRDIGWYLDDMAALPARPEPDHMPRATEYIPAMGT